MRKLATLLQVYEDLASDATQYQLELFAQQVLALSDQYNRIHSYFDMDSSSIEVLEAQEIWCKTLAYIISGTSVAPVFDLNERGICVPLFKTCNRIVKAKQAQPSYDMKKLKEWITSMLQVRFVVPSFFFVAETKTSVKVCNSRFDNVLQLDVEVNKKPLSKYYGENVTVPVSQSLVFKVSGYVSTLRNKPSKARSVQILLRTTAQQTQQTMHSIIKNAPLLKNAFSLQFLCPFQEEGLYALSMVTHLQDKHNRTCAMKRAKIDRVTIQVTKREGITRLAFT